MIGSGRFAQWTMETSNMAVQFTNELRDRITTVLNKNP